MSKMGWLTAGAAFLVGAHDACAGEAIDKTLAVKPDGVVRIENVRGHIDVQGWERDEVSVTGTLDDRATSFTFDSSGATTTVKVETPDNLHGGEGSNLTIKVPVASRVRVGLVSADLQLSNLHGGVDAKTVSGGIEALDVGGRLELATVSGDVELKGATGPIRFNSVSGELQARVDADEIDIETVSGDATVHADKPLTELTLHSVSGEFAIDGDLGKGGRVKASTTSGDVRLTLGPNAGAVVDLSSTAGGRIKNGLTDARARKGAAFGEELEFTLGDGGGAIDLTTVSGTLELRPR
jgi:DUF4097 and DUF4098 domain-containing protein YvlB